MRAAIYRRVSTRGQARDDHFSLDEQLERCTQRCREKGFEIVADLTDIHSGSVLEERPQMSRLIDMMYGREIDVVVATTLDRLSRDQNHFGVIHHIASKYQVAIELTEEVYEDTSMGQFLRSVSGFIAQVEREKIRERTRRGVRQRVRAGLMLPSGIPLYGYLYADNMKSRYIENPDTAPIVRRIWDAAVAGEPQGTIARRLTEDGIPTPRDYLRMQKNDPNDPPRGFGWSRSTVWSILNTSAYWGQHTAFHREEVKRYRTDPKTHQVTIIRGQKVNPIGEKRTVLPDAAPALVTVEMVQEVQRRFEENRRAAARNNTDPERALLRAGYAKCGLCGANLIMKSYIHKGVKGTVRAYTYYCRRRRLCKADINHCPGVQMAVHKLDKLVWDHVLRFIRDPHGILVEAGKHPEYYRQEDMLEAYRKELKTLEKRELNVRKAIQLIEDDSIAGLVADIKSLAARKSQMQMEIERLENERAGRINVQARIDAVQLWVNELDRRHVDFTYLEKRATLYGCNICVTVFPSSEGPRYKVVAGTHGDVVLFDGTMTLWSEQGDCAYAL